MLIEVTQNTLFSAITSGRVKPHEALVIDGDRIGNLAGLLGWARYLVEQELIEDEPTSDEEDEEAVEGAVEGAIEGTAETVEGTVEAPQEPKTEGVAKIPYEKPQVYKYDTIATARNPDGTPVLPVHKAYTLHEDGMTFRQIADRYGIQDARSVSTAARNYGKKYRKEPDATAILMAAPRMNGKRRESDDEDN